MSHLKGSKVFPEQHKVRPSTQLFLRLTPNSGGVAYLSPPESHHLLRILRTVNLDCHRRPAEAVLSDSNLVWAITQTLLSRRSKTLQSFDLKEWHALRSINAAFRDAVEGQPLTVHLSQQLDEQGKLCLQQTKLPIAELYCCAGDQLVIQALLSRPYRSAGMPDRLPLSDMWASILPTHPAIQDSVCICSQEGACHPLCAFVPSPCIDLYTL